MPISFTHLLKFERLFEFLDAVYHIHTSRSIPFVEFLKLFLEVPYVL